MQQAMVAVGMVAAGMVAADMVAAAVMAAAVGACVGGAGRERQRQGGGERECEFSHGLKILPVVSASCETNVAVSPSGSDSTQASLGSVARG